MLAAGGAGTAAGGAPASITTEAADIATTASWSRTWTGMDRTVDFDHYAGLPEGAGHLVREDGAVAAVAWSNRTRRSAWRAVDHVTIAPGAEPVAVTIAALRAALGDAPGLVRPSRVRTRPCRGCWSVAPGSRTGTSTARRIRPSWTRTGSCRAPASSERMGAAGPATPPGYSAATGTGFSIGTPIRLPYSVHDAVVVADPAVAEQLVEDEPGVARALADPAVGDDVLVGGHALGLVQGRQLVGRLERAVLAHGLGPRDRRGARDVAGPLGGLAHAGRRDDLAVELGRAAHVDQGQPGVAEARQDVVAEGAQREVGLGQLVAGRGVVGTSTVSGRPWSSQYLRPPLRIRTSRGRTA